MALNIILTRNFKKEAKHLIKKYPSVKLELQTLGVELAENPDIGIHLGDSVFKVRLAVASKGRGKSGGARVIFYVQIDEATVLLLSIYSKGEKDTISDNEIKELLKRYV